MAVGDSRAPGPRQVPNLPPNGGFVTPNDSTVFQVPVAIEVLDAGTLVVTPAGQESADVTITVTAGMIPWMPKFMVKAVKATGTSATLILASWG